MKKQKQNFVGAIRFFSGDRANVKIAVKEDGEIKPCGAIFADNKILNVFKDIAGERNVKIL